MTKKTWNERDTKFCREILAEFDRIIREGVPEGWQEMHSTIKSVLCGDGPCLLCPLTICCATLAHRKMDAALANRGAHTIACVRMRRDELRAHFDKIGLEWREPESEPKPKPKPKRVWNPEVLEMVSKWGPETGFYDILEIGCEDLSCKNCPLYHVGCSSWPEIKANLESIGFPGFEKAEPAPDLAAENAILKEALEKIREVLRKGELL